MKMNWLIYVMVNNRAYYIHEIWKPEVLKKAMRINVGDILDIKGLGKLEVWNLYVSDDDIDDDICYKEVGLMCKRVV